MEMNDWPGKFLYYNRFIYDSDEEKEEADARAT